MTLTQRHLDIKLTATHGTMHVGIMAGLDVPELESIQAASSVISMLAEKSKLGCVSTLQRRGCTATVTEARERSVPVLFLPMQCDHMQWLRMINMAVCIDSGKADPLLDQFCDTYNTLYDQGEVTYPFIYCHKENSYAIEVM